MSENLSYLSEQNPDEFWKAIEKGKLEKKKKKEYTELVSEPVAPEISVEEKMAYIQEFHKESLAKLPKQKKPSLPTRFTANKPTPERTAPEVVVSLPEPKKTKIKKTWFSNKRFIGKLEAGMCNSMGKSIQNPTILLLYLLQNEAWKDKEDKHKTWEYWYCKRGLIVASVGIKKMAMDLEVSESTIKNWSKALESDNYIVRHKEGRENVYVLGEVVGQDKLYLYSAGTDREKRKKKIKESLAENKRGSK